MKIFGLVGFALILASPALADPIPPSADPNHLDQRFDQPKVPQSEPPAPVILPEQPPPPEAASSIKLTLDRVILDGVTVYPAPLVKTLTAALVGHPITLADIYSFRDMLTAKYRGDGYTLSQVIVPAQRIEDGILRLQAVEGYISEVGFEGVDAAKTAQLRPIFDPVLAEHPVKIASLERAVLLAEDMLGLSVKTVVKPSSTQGAAALVVIAEERPIYAAVTIDNRGSRSVGPVQFGATLTVPGLIYGLGSTTLRTIGTPDIDQLRLFDFTQILPVGRDGAELTFSARQTRSDPGASVTAFHIKSDDRTFNLVGSYPLIRSRSETLQTNLGMLLRDSVSKTAGSDLTTDRIRSISAGGSWDFADSHDGRTLLDGTVWQGINGLGASRPGSAGLSETDARTDFTKFTADFQHTQPLFGAVGLAVAFSGQAALARLVSSEQFSLGGTAYARAFDPAELTGDSGWGGRVELQYNVPVPSNYLNYIQVYAGPSGGEVHEQTTTARGWAGLASVEAGLRVGVAQHVDLDLQLSEPFEGVPADTNNYDVRGFFSVVVHN